MVHLCHLWVYYILKSNQSGSELWVVNKKGSQSEKYHLKAEKYLQNNETFLHLPKKKKKILKSRPDRFGVKEENIYIVSQDYTFKVAVASLEFWYFRA